MNLLNELTKNVRCRVAWVLPVIVFISLYAVGGKHFSLTPPSDVPTKVHSGVTLSFIALTFGAFSGWVPMAADYVSLFEASSGPTI
jgi:purine-cytosine permease-like protein